MFTDHEQYFLKVTTWCC